MWSVVSLWDLHNLHRGELKYVIRCAKRLYYSRKFSKVSGNIRYDELRGKSKTGIKASFKIDGELVKNKRVISNGFNMFFSSIAKKLNSKICSSKPLRDGNTSHDVPKYRKYCNKKVENSIFLHPYDSEEIEIQLKAFRVTRPVTSQFQLSRNVFL